MASFHFNWIYYSRKGTKFLLIDPSTRMLASLYFVTSWSIKFELEPPDSKHSFIILSPGTLGELSQRRPDFVSELPIFAPHLTDRRAQPRMTGIELALHVRKDLSRSVQNVNRSTCSMSNNLGGCSLKSFSIFLSFIQSTTDMFRRLKISSKSGTWKTVPITVFSIMIQSNSDEPNIWLSLLEIQVYRLSQV